MLAGASADPHDLRRLARSERDGEALERLRKSVANRLDESFLTGPAVEESERSVARREGEISFVFPNGKAARGDLVRIRQLAHGFDVNADLAAGREAVHRDILGVRKVEAHAAIDKSRRERRLAARPIAEFDGGGRHAEA